MMGGPFIIFVNVPSILVVIGGTFAVILMRVTLGDFLGSFKIGLKEFFYKHVCLTNLQPKVQDLYLDTTLQSYGNYSAMNYIYLT